MDIYISAYNHVSPMKILLRLRKYNLKAKAFPLVIGGKRMGSYKFLITQISNSIEKVYKNGKLITVRASVTFKEYIYKKKKSKKSRMIGYWNAYTFSQVESHSFREANSSQTSSGNSKTENSSGKKTSKVKGYEAYTVKEGDTLWTLAERYYKDGTKYKKIFNANKTESKGFHVIANPSKIYPGWVIKIPV